ncbi:hypothetical protein [Actinoplanes sp. NPDC049802]|uniref:hypothetical protein n=1 Tax=Actinoplanes sp. NPDC049802 TaxID=3154742 RepID=UPI0033E67864
MSLRAVPMRRLRLHRLVVLIDVPTLHGAAPNLAGPHDHFVFVVGVALGSLRDR